MEEDGLTIAYAEEYSRGDGALQRVPDKVDLGAVSAPVDVIEPGCGVVLDFEVRGYAASLQSLMSIARAVEPAVADRRHMIAG